MRIVRISHSPPRPRTDRDEEYPEPQEDRCGGLSGASLYGSGDEWSGFEITKAEFERVWNSDTE